MEQPGDADCRRVAFVVGLIDLFADKALLCSGNIFLGCFAATGKQLFDGSRRNFFIDSTAFLPCRQIGDTHYLEQCLRFVRETGETLFPHEHVVVLRLFAEQIVDGGEDFAVAGFAVSRVQMAQALNLNISTLIPLNGKAWTS